MACLVSGGKDSIAAACVVWQWGWRIDSFVTVLPEERNPELFHHPNARWVRLQAEAAGVPWRAHELPQGADESAGLEAALRGLSVDGIVSGALASEYQRTRFERVCHGLGLRTFAPLWHHEPHQHLQNVRSLGIRARLAHVAAEGLGREWLGRELDEAAIAVLARVSLRSRLNVAGEGGEYETFVTDAPLFRQSIRVTASRVDWRRDEGTWVIDGAELAPRPAGSPSVSPAGQS